MWNLAVSNGLESVHPTGHPMSQQTHSGFNAPLSSSGVTIVRSLARAPLPPHLQSAAPPVLFIAVGVGHIIAAICKPGLPLESRWFGPPFVPSVARGVGKNPHPVAFVRCAGLIRSDNTPLRIEPQRGKVFQHDLQSSRSEKRGVFDETERRLDLSEDSGELGPQAGSGSGDPSTLPGCGNVLAGKSAGDEVNPPTPGVPVEGANIVPDGEPGQESVPLSLEEDRPRVFLQLDGADWHMAEKESAKDSATGSGEEVQFTKWNIQGCLGRVRRMDSLKRGGFRGGRACSLFR